jgi:hypothetical protein
MTNPIFERDSIQHSCLDTSLFAADLIIQPLNTKLSRYPVAIRVRCQKNNKGDEPLWTRRHSDTYAAIIGLFHGSDDYTR